MTINQALTLAKKIMYNHTELRYWNVTLNNRKRSFGVCSYGKQEIQLSSLLIPVMTDEAIKDTIIHEIAHALCPQHHHDYVWQAKCIELGGNGQRCGGADKYKEGNEGMKECQEKLAKYTMTCPCCGNKGYKNRRPTSARSCGICSPYRYNEKFKLVLTQNY